MFAKGIKTALKKWAKKRDFIIKSNEDVITLSTKHVALWYGDLQELIVISHVFNTLFYVDSDNKGHVSVNFHWQ